jgi:hypothetical protein
MAKCERIGELVDLCEKAQSLAAELNLTFVAFLANMVVLEARQAHYFSDDDAEAAMPADDAGAAAHHRRRAVKRPLAQQTSSVASLAARRNARHLTLIVSPDLSRADQRYRPPTAPVGGAPSGS